jgi:hypothetical protein
VSQGIGVRSFPSDAARRVVGTAAFSGVAGRRLQDLVAHRVAINRTDGGRRE